MEQKKKQSNSRLLSCGFTSGLLQAVVFHPWDRALYLSVKVYILTYGTVLIFRMLIDCQFVQYSRPFLSSPNFAMPMAGALQTLVQRALSSGLYFPLEDIFSMKLRAMEWDAPSSLLNFIAGTCAGAVNGFVLNPAARVKVWQYHTSIGCVGVDFD